MTPLKLQKLILTGTQEGASINERYQMKTNRRKPVFFLFMMMVVIHLFTPLKVGGPTSYFTVKPGVIFKNIQNGGAITFSADFTTTLINWVDNFIRFSDFDMGTSWEVIGFACPSGATMQITEASSTQVKATVTTPRSATFHIYLGGRGSPTSITGVNSWNYGDYIVSFLASSGSVVLTWAESIPVVSTPSTFLDPMNQYLQLGDVSGFIIATYTDILGTAFFALVLLAPVLGVYLRSGAGPALLVMILGWGIFSVVVPSEGLSLGFLLVALCGGLFIAWTLLRMRSRY